MNILLRVCVLVQHFCRVLSPCCFLLPNSHHFTRWIPTIKPSVSLFQFTEIQISHLYLHRRRFPQFLIKAFWTRMLSSQFEVLFIHSWLSYPWTLNCMSSWRRHRMAPSRTQTSAVPVVNRAPNDTQLYKRPPCKNVSDADKNGGPHQVNMRIHLSKSENISRGNT